MQISMSNNPIDKLSCWIYNKKEELSQVKWITGKQKEVECRICGDKLNNRRDMYSPMQCGWRRIGKYTWICHSCLDHRNFRPYIEQIDEENRLYWEEHNLKSEKIRLKAKEIIDLLKEYLPEYKETLDLYDFYDVDFIDENGNVDEIDFSFTIEDANEEYVLDIRNTSILKATVNNKEAIKIANYLDEEVAKTCTYENPWTWDDAIKVIKKQIEDKK